MTEAVVVAIITGAFTLAGTYLMQRKKSQDDAVKEAQREQRQTDRLERIEEKIGRLEHKVDIHNGYAEKLGAIQKDIEYLRKERP